MKTSFSFKWALEILFHINIFLEALIVVIISVFSSRFLSFKQMKFNPIIIKYTTENVWNVRDIYVLIVYETFDVYSDILHFTLLKICFFFTYYYAFEVIYFTVYMSNFHGAQLSLWLHKIWDYIKNIKFLNI